MQFIYNWISKKITELVKYFFLIFVSNETCRAKTYWTKTYWAQNILGNILDQNIFIPKHIVPKTYSYQNILEPKHIRPKTYWTIICIISTMGFYTLFFRLLQWKVFYHRFMLFFGFFQWIVMLNRHAHPKIDDPLLPLQPLFLRAKLFIVFEPLSTVDPL